MQFDRIALDAKHRHLDAIAREPERLRRVVRTLLEGADGEITSIARPWEPGGGASLFKVTTARAAYFLKVKHLAVTVESKLESEPAFSREPSLRNEHRFLERLAGEPFVPVVHGYVEDGDTAFLLLEWLTPFNAAIATLGPGALADAFARIGAAVHALYARGIVHTDVHEKNLLFRGTTPVLADFEEARELAQAEPFAESLDVVGETPAGNVGAMPTGHDLVPGLTCLARLREVFAALVRARLDPLIRSCNFDSSCPFLTTLDHGSDDRVYQSIQIPGLTIAGQRPPDDPRIAMIARVGTRLFDRPYTHLDVGSNVGMFNVAMARQPQVRRSIGVEAYDKYVELAKALAFLAGVDDVAFHCAIAGEDSIAARLGGEPVDLVTIYSVYHHIRHKDRFLADLAALGPTYVLLEMASQRECYEGRSWEQEVESIADGLGMPYGEVIGRSADYERPIVLLAKTPIPPDLRSDAMAPSATPQRVMVTPQGAAATSPHPAVTAAKPMLPSPPDVGGRAPRVSVVLPVYNHCRFLPRAIGSVLAQTFTDFELVVVNDGSTDGTREYLDGLADPRIVVVHQENQRLPRALNAGFGVARGELLTWVSADNSCAPMFLEALVGALDHHPDAGFAYSAFTWIDGTDRILGVHRDQDVTVRSLLKQNPGIAAFLYRRACQEEVGPYDPALEGAEDWDMWLRIVERRPAVYVPEILYDYRLHDDSMTAQKRDRVAQASRAVVTRALERRGGRLDLHELYPSLPECTDRAAAELHACLDFGTSLLQSPWAPVELALPFLEAACSIRRDPVVLANHAIACARAGRWGDAHRDVAELRGSLTSAGPTNETVLRIADALEAAAARDANDAAMRIAPLVVDRTGIELFEREDARRCVYAITDPPAAAAPVVTPAPARPSHDPAAATKDAPPRSPAAARTASATTPPPSASVVAPARPHAVPSRPMVSVIVPTHDRPEMLREAVASILAQTYRDFEIVVVNDAGADVTHVLGELDGSGCISHVRHARNRGLAAARNSGIGVARGKYIAYLDDDDRFYPEHLETLVGALEHWPHRVAYTDALRVTQVQRDGRYATVARDRPYSHDFDRDRLLVVNCFPVLCVMHDRACLDAVGAFDETMTSHEDWELWLRMSARFPFAHLATITAEFTYRVDGSSMTSSMQPDYLRTAEIIYERTAADVAGRPQLVAAREQFLAALRASVAATPAMRRQPTPTPAAAPRSGVSVPASARDSDVDDGARPFDCSIIIPVFNRAELTEQCLVNLADVTRGATFEVVLVDNGSTDGTAALLASLGGDVQVITNPENRGFAAACNQGARAARGHHLVFLNNDTIPLDGWLEPLLAELDADPRVAAVGSKLLFADGTVQHAGVIFMRELPMPYHPFHRAAASHPSVNVRRELSAVTAACVAMRRSAFAAVGGFDEGFVNGFEDVDLCLKLRARGDTVVYQPRSTLYHLESQTPGRKDHDEANGRRLLERWGARWWRIGDEDVVLVPEGLAACAKEDGVAIVTLTEVTERARWDAVRRVQRALLDGDVAVARRLVAATTSWPDDPGVRRWVERVRHHVDAAATPEVGAPTGG